MKAPLKKAKEERGYYSCVDFENLYNKKKKSKSRYTTYRKKHYSDSELFEKKKVQIKKKNGCMYVQKHYIPSSKDNDRLYLFDNITIYKNHFDKYEEKNDEKLSNLKKILKIYENVTTNEKKKLYELIKFFSFTQGGFQNDKLRQKLWLLLLGFNINLSKEKNYNDHPISILCMKHKNKFKFVNSAKHFKLKWIQEEDGAGDWRPRECAKGDLRQKGGTTPHTQSQNKIYYYDNFSCPRKEEFVFTYGVSDEGGGLPPSADQGGRLPPTTGAPSEGCPSVGRTKSSDKDGSGAQCGNKAAAHDGHCRNRKSTRARRRFYQKEEDEKCHSASPSASPAPPSCSSRTSSTPSGRTELLCIPALEAVDHCASENSLYLSDSFISSTTSFTASSVSSFASNCSDDMDMVGSKSRSRQKRRTPPLHFFSSSHSNDGAREGRSKGSKSLKRRSSSKRVNAPQRSVLPGKAQPNDDSFPFFSEEKYPKKKKTNKIAKREIEKQAKRCIEKKTKKIIHFLLHIDKEKNNYDKKKNIKFIIKLFKVIYKNMLEVDLYIVDYILRKNQTKEDTNILSYLKYNIENNYNFNSNLNKWIIDSVLLDENERVQVKKDVKRSVNTWNIHKYNIYEIKKKYQYILKNVICSILYKHSNKIFYAQGVHDVCLVFVTLYFHHFLRRYKKYVFLEHFISKFVVNKICDFIFSKLKRECNGQHPPGGSTSQVFFPHEGGTAEQEGKKVSTPVPHNNEDGEAKGGTLPPTKRKGPLIGGDIFQNNIYDMFLMEERYIEKICLLNNINLERYIKYKKKKKKKEYIVYLLCERFLLFYMIDYLTLSLDVSINNTFKSIGLLLKYMDKEVYNVFCLLQKEQQYENMKYVNRSERASLGGSRNGGSEERGANRGKEQQNDSKSDTNQLDSKRNSLKLSGTEFFFCLSWVVTYYSHVFTEFEKLARIFDTLLSNDGIFIIYFTSAIILHKKEELIQIANKKKKEMLYNNMYTETHYIFQNMKWKDLNVDNIIKKTYYYMNYKIPQDTFLEKIRKKISFPPFSPIYSYPFILHYFHYEREREELRNRSVEQSIRSFYAYSKAGGAEERQEERREERQDKRQGEQQEDLQDELPEPPQPPQPPQGEGNPSKECTPANACSLNVPPSKMKTYDEYIHDLLGEQSEGSPEEKRKNPLWRGEKHSKDDNNIYLHYPHSILCNHLEMNKEIIKKHLLVEDFFQYVFYDFIVSYKDICNRQRIRSKKKCYIIQYIKVKGRREHLLIKRKKKKKKNKYEKILHRMAKHVTFLYQHKCRKEKKNKKYMYMNFTTKGKKNAPLSSFRNLPHHKRNQKTIAIIPPIYKYIVQDSLVMENLGHSKKSKLNKAAEKDRLQKQKKRLPYIYYLLRTSIHDSPYFNFFLFFFVVSLFSSLLYYHR
ncbi:conserved Plasmodium protein, unknown function [Plasmodium vivax]|uniref:Rab-GAP TBC domain-containing protein n=1 Tax=Plasmodium vivax North Korean TaxID=1035514 RepID=A0A0J9TVW1_PLAVI|nr:hypothetical protein PVNG_02127 [Plasmodium vivax North Korean]CAI7720070.1 conserved Plasmodium protein, unknown function [Plasmodium vivax]